MRGHCILLQQSRVFFNYIHKYTRNSSSDNYSERIIHFIVFRMNMVDMSYPGVERQTVYTCLHFIEYILNSHTIIYL